MELGTSTLRLVASIGSGSKTTSTQPQESQLRAVAQTEAEMTHALTQMVTSVIVMVMAARYTNKLGVETTTPKSSSPEKCAAFVAAVKVLVKKRIQLKKTQLKKKIQLKKKTQLKKKIMKKRNKMTQLNALTQMVSSLIVMVMAAIDTKQVGVEATTKETSIL